LTRFLIRRSDLPVGGFFLAVVALVLEIPSGDEGLDAYGQYACRSGLLQNRHALRCNGA